MTDNVHTLHNPARDVPKNASITNQFGTDCDIPNGLVIFSLDSPELMTPVSNTFTQLARRGSKKFGVGIPRGSQVVSVCNGKHHARHTERLSAANKMPENATQHEIRDLGPGAPINWISTEGVRVLKSEIRGCSGWVVLQQASFGPLSAANFEALSCMRKMAEEGGFWIVLIVVVAEGSDKYQLDQCCDEHITVKSCEPDFGFDSAFSIDVASLRYLNCVGIGKTMCNVKLANGMFMRRYTPFISSQLEDRVIWALRTKGHILDDIAKLVKKNKSTVLRRLQNMPPLRQLKSSAEMLSHYLGAPPAVPSSTTTVADNNSAEEVSVASDTPD